MTILKYTTSTIFAFVVAPLGGAQHHTSTIAVASPMPIDDETLARRELARIMPSGARLLELAARNPPFPAWFDEEEDAPF